MTHRAPLPCGVEADYLVADAWFGTRTMIPAVYEAGGVQGVDLPEVEEEGLTFAPSPGGLVERRASVPSSEEWRLFGGMAP